MIKRILKRIKRKFGIVYAETNSKPLRTTLVVFRDGLRFLGRRFGIVRSAGRKGSVSVNWRSAAAFDTKNIPSAPLYKDYKYVPKKIYIIPAHVGERNTTRYRAYNLKELLGQFGACEILPYGELQGSFLAEINSGTCVVVVQRVPVRNEVDRRFFETLRASGSLIVYDIDDAIFDKDSIEKWRVEEIRIDPDSYREAMSYADHYIVSTTSLRSIVETLFKKPVHVLQNVINAQLIELSQTRADRGSIVSIGFTSGSKTHDADYRIVESAILEVLEKYQSLTFTCVGHVDVNQGRFRKFGNRVRFIDAVDWRALPAIISKFDVLLCPLEKSIFNEQKSHLKFIEAAIVGTPCIVSDVGESGRTVIDGLTGMIVQNETSCWVDAIERLLTEPSLARSMGEAANQHVRKYYTTAAPYFLSLARSLHRDLSIGLMTDKISVLLVSYNNLDDVTAAVTSLYDTTYCDFQLLVWNNSPDSNIREYLEGLVPGNVMVVNSGRNVGKAKGANYLLRNSIHRFICAADDDYVFPSNWDLLLLQAAKAVRNLGWLSSNLSPESSGIRDRGKVVHVDGDISLFAPAGVGGWIVFTSATARERIGFYKEHGLYGGVDGDYNRRARALGLTTGYVRRLVGGHKINRGTNLAWELFKQRIQDEMRVHGKHSDLVSDKFVDFQSDKSSRLRISIKLCTPVSANAEVWGDTHFAYGLQAALEKFAFDVDMSFYGDWHNHDESDITIHLFGLHKYVPDPKKINILWIISHTDLVDEAFLKGFDYIFSASRPFLDTIRRMVPELRSEVLYQCTDAKVFHPDQETKKDIDIAFVGNSRRVFRESVKFALESGYDISVWGTHWEEYIDRKYIKGQSLDTESVADVYRRSKVVLNDHWSDQKRDGLVNNRVFDVLACNTVVVSDANSGIFELFGDDVPMYGTAKELDRLLAIHLSEGSEGSTTDLCTRVLENHTFDNRAAEINNAIKFVIENYVNYKSERRWKESQ